MVDANETSKIVEFFRNSVVFLTGGTGFIGKTLIYKLISTCEVSCIYLLVRKKCCNSIEERLMELFENEVFIRLRNESPDYVNRIKLIEGDCTRGNLGITAYNEELLCQSVDFVIHCAAEMNKMESFKSMVEINIFGTKELVKLANKMINLKAFVHVSSLASHWDRDVFDEKLYESNLDYEDCLNLLKIDQVLPMDKHDKAKILGNKWSLYSLTKAVSESIFLCEQISVPVVIFRFPFAFTSWKEPFAGFVDGFYGPSGFIMLNLLNIVWFCPWSTQIFDFVPVDMTVNALLAATRHSYDEFHTSKENKGKKNLFIYNYSIRSEGCKTGVTVQYALSKWKKDHNFKPNFDSNEMTFKLSCILFGYIPVVVVDFFASLFGKKLGLYQACDNAVDMNLRIVRSKYASNNVYDNNLVNCWNNLSDIDKKLFSFDLNELIWDDYSPVMFNSAQEFVGKLLEKDRNVRLAVFWMPKIRFALKTLYFMLGLYCIYMIYSLLG